MPASRKLRSIVALAALPLSCQAMDQPREVSVDFPEVIVSSEPVRVIVRVTRSDGVRTESEGKHDFSVEPADLASLAAGGELRCQRSGDGKVTVKIGSVSNTRALRCRIVAKIELSDVERLEMGSAPVDPKLKVLDKAGRELADVPVSLTSNATTVLQAKGAVLIPLQVGKATVLARAGEVTKELKLEVIRRLTPEALPMNDNTRINYSLDAGHYELSMKLPSPHKVTIEWRGAPYCGYSATGTEHSSVCTLQGKGGVVFDNPAFLKDGTKTVSTEGVSLLEIP